MLSFIKNIGIFIICAQCLMHFTAGKEYEKYVKLLIGFMILGQFVIPIRSVFLGKEQAEIWNSIEQFQEELSAAAGDHTITYDMEEQVSQSLMEEITAKLEQPAQKAGYRVESASMAGKEGEERLVIVLKSTGRKEEESGAGTQAQGNPGIIEIEPVDITIRAEPLPEQTADAEETEEGKAERELKEEFARRLGVDADYLRLRFR